MVYSMLHAHDLPAFVMSLSNCIFEHLPMIPTEDVFVSRKRMLTEKVGESALSFPLSVSLSGSLLMVLYVAGRPFSLE